MPFQVAAGIVGSADHGNIAAADQIPCRKLQRLQLGIAQVPDFLSGIGVQNALVTKIILQFQMAPVVHGVADAPGQRLGKFLELLPIRCVAGDVVFVHTIGAHDAPLIVVTAQPEPGDILELHILINCLGIQMAMVIHDGHFLCRFVVKCSTQKKPE